MQPQLRKFVLNFVYDSSIKNSTSILDVVFVNELFLS